MARNRKKMSLYEVIRRTQLKPSVDKSSDQSQQVEADKDKPSAMSLTGWPRRPRIVQFNAGRIEFSLPYQIAIAILLGIVLMILLVYRLGQASERATTKLAEKTPNSIRHEAEPTIAEPVRTTDVAEKSTPAASSPVVKAVPMFKGNNRIVITQYPQRTDLVPVQKYFAQKGIETEIVKIDDAYFLRTVDKYETPGRFGTDGYYARQRIIECGAEYKAPQGYETFGSKPFQDAYGRRFDD